MARSSNTNHSERDSTFMKYCWNILWRKGRTKLLFGALSRGLVNNSQKDYVLKLDRAEFAFKIEFPGEYKVLSKLRTMPSKGGGDDTNLEGGCESYFSSDPSMYGDPILSDDGCDQLRMIAYSRIHLMFIVIPMVVMRFVAMRFMVKMDLEAVACVCESLQRVNWLQKGVYDQWTWFRWVFVFRF